MKQKVTSSLIGLFLLYLASQMWLSGFNHFKPYFYAYRDLISPELPLRLTKEWHVDDLILIIIRFHSVIMTLAGTLFIM